MSKVSKIFPGFLLIAFLCAGQGVPSGDSRLDAPSENTDSQRNMSDMDRDGFPDAAELPDETDRACFRRWFVAIAESQFYSIHPHWPEIRRDCTGLICFAYKEALKIHDNSWKKGFKYLTDPAGPDVRSFHYPDVPLIGTDLFRTQPGPFEEKDLGSAAFQPVATAQVLMQYNCRFLGKEPGESLAAGDLLFFSYMLDDRPVYHAMILVKTFPGNETDGIVVYHTGPDGIHSGEVRKLRLSTLNRHPDDTWHVNPGNSHFLGFYRLNILEYDHAFGDQGAFLLMPEKSVQKKQAFEMRYIISENPRAVQGGLGRRPILKSRLLDP